MKLNIFPRRFSNWKCKILLFNFELGTPKLKQIKFNLRVTNSKLNFSFFDIELVTRYVTF